MIRDAIVAYHKNGQDYTIIAVNDDLDCILPEYISFAVDCYHRGMDDTEEIVLARILSLTPDEYSQLLDEKTEPLLQYLNEYPDLITTLSSFIAADLDDLRGCDSPLIAVRMAVYNQLIHTL